jgi:hypothetical protein
VRFINGKPVLRCSSLDQLIECSGSRTAIEAMGQLLELDDSASWEGQWCHFAAAQRFVTMNGAMAPEGGLIGPKIPKDWKPDSFAEWIVDFYHRAVMEETPGDWAMAVEMEILVEFKRFWLSGHIDEAAFSPDATEINFDDLKSGSNIVDAAECNWQVLGYSALLKSEYEVARRIRGRIVQPRVREGEGKRITQVVLDERGIWGDDGERIGTATINTFVGLLEARINEALDNPLVLNSGIKQCRWCPVGEQLQCPALWADFEAMKIELTKEMLARLEAQPNDALLVKYAAGKKLLGPKLEKAWGLLKERLEAINGTLEVDGVKAMLRDWQGAREFTPEGKAAAWTEIAGALDEERAYECMSLSVPQMEKAFAVQLKIPQSSKEKDSGEKQVEHRFGQYMTRKQGKQLTLVV